MEASTNHRLYDMVRLRPVCDGWLGLSAPVAHFLSSASTKGFQTDTSYDWLWPSQMIREIIIDIMWTHKFTTIGTAKIGFGRCLSYWMLSFLGSVKLFRGVQPWKIWDSWDHPGISKDDRDGMKWLNHQAWLDSGGFSSLKRQKPTARLEIQPQVLRDRPWDVESVEHIVNCL